MYPITPSLSSGLSFRTQKSTKSIKASPAWTKNLSKLKDLRISSPLIYNMGNFPHSFLKPLFFENRANWHLLTAGAMVKAHLQEIRHRSLAENRELFKGELLGVSCRGYRPADFCWRPPIKRKQSDSWEPLLIKDLILGKIEIDCRAHTQ